MYGIKVCGLLFMSLFLCYAEFQSGSGPVPTVTSLDTMCKDQQLIDGNYPNPQTCSSYIACVGGNTYIMPCPEGLYFKAEGYCEFPENVPECNEEQE